MIIEAQGLARTFTSRNWSVEAVRGVNLTVKQGEIVGFLGPNGAGKTTTLRMLTTLLRPTAGTATVAGCDLRRDPVGVRRRIGYVPQAIGETGGGTDPNCLVGEELTIQGRVYRLSAAQAAKRANLLTDQLSSRASPCRSAWRSCACGSPGGPSSRRTPDEGDPGPGERAQAG